MISHYKFTFVYDASFCNGSGALSRQKKTKTTTIIQHIFEQKNKKNRENWIKNAGVQGKKKREKARQTDKNRVVDIWLPF